MRSFRELCFRKNARVVQRRRAMGEIATNREFHSRMNSRREEVSQGGRTGASGRKADQADVRRTGGLAILAIPGRGLLARLRQ